LLAASSWATMFHFLGESLAYCYRYGPIILIFFFLKRGKSFAYPLIKKKDAQLINGKPG
jgi:hypothetical protein